MTAPVDQPDSPPLPPPSPRHPLFSMGGPLTWATPEEEEPTTSSSPEPGEEHPQPAGLSAGGDDWRSDADDESDESSTTSSPASSADDEGPRVTQLLSKAQLRQTARQGVKITSAAAHTLGARTEAQQLVGLYLADDDDAANIGNPLADIAHRRGDVVGGKLSPDANSALQALMGLAGYLAKQVAKVHQVRALESQPAGVVEHG